MSEYYPTLPVDAIHNEIGTFVAQLADSVTRIFSQSLGISPYILAAAASATTGACDGIVLIPSGIGDYAPSATHGPAA